MLLPASLCCYEPGEKLASELPTLADLMQRTAEERVVMEMPTKHAVARKGLCKDACMKFLEQQLHALCSYAVAKTGLPFTWG